MNTYKLEEKTKQRIAKLQSMTRQEMKAKLVKAEELDDYEAVELFNNLRRKNDLAYRQVASTSYQGGSRINEIRFNIAYEKYFGSE